MEKGKVKSEKEDGRQRRKGKALLHFSFFTPPLFTFHFSLRTSTAPSLYPLPERAREFLMVRLRCLR